jgi:hypothetical protein
MTGNRPASQLRQNPGRINAYTDQFRTTQPSPASPSTTSNRRSGQRAVPALALKPSIAVLQLLYTEATRSSGFFLKKKPPCTPVFSARVLENRSKWNRRRTDLALFRLYEENCANNNGEFFS